MIRAGAEVGTLFFPHYGCDAFGLVQAEYRGKLAFRFRWAGAPWEERGEERDDRGESAGTSRPTFPSSWTPGEAGRWIPDPMRRWR